MRQIKGSDPIIDQMVKGNDEIIYNLFYVIRTSQDPYIVTDDISYIFAQSNPNTPIWIYSNDEVDIDSKQELLELLLERIKLNNKVHIVARNSWIISVLNRLSDILDIQIEEYMPMTVYACYQVDYMEELGEIVLPDQQYIKQIAELAKQQTWDAEHFELSDVDALKFAESNKDSKNLYLWKNKDIVAMARVAHKNDKYARLNTVVTERSHRGNGYARMLVGNMSKELLKEGIVPMLYADSNNPSSKSAYIKIGFVEIGRIIEYRIM